MRGRCLKQFGLAAMLTALGLGAWVSPALASIGAGGSQMIPDQNGVGDSPTMQIAIAAFGGGTVTLNSVQFTPSCGAPQGGAYPCPNDKLDPDVFSFGTTSVTGSDSCSGVTFSRSAPNATTGEVTFTPMSQATIPNLGSCTLSFPMTVLKLPTRDTLVGTPGKTTVQRIQANGTDGGNAVTGRFDPQSTVFGQLTVLTPLLPSTVLTTENLTPRVAVSGTTYDPGTPDGSLTIGVFGPNECELPPYAVATLPVTGNGTYSAPTLANLPPGTWGIGVTYVPGPGDEGNSNRSLGCGQPGTLFQVVPPQVVPPPVPASSSPVTTKQKRKCKKGRKLVKRKAKKRCVKRKRGKGK